jgi:sialate O-acetylesterase
MIVKKQQHSNPPVIPANAGIHVTAHHVPTLLATILLLAHTSLAAIEPAGVFSDSMVLQRDIDVPVWGWATVGEEITVSFNGQTVTATARDSTVAAYNGYWKAWLAPMSAGGPYDMTISGTVSSPVTLRNVLVGDVWLCSGQSNMRYSMDGMYYNDGSDEVQALPPDGSPFTQIRMCRIGPSWASSPVLDLRTSTEWNDVDQRISAPWRSCSRTIGRQFSAAGTTFGIRVHEATGVPIGLISAAVGASPMRSFISPQLSDTIVYIQCGSSPDSVRQGFTPVRFTTGNANSETNGALFCGMINPLVGLGIKGVIWWQGEEEGGGFDPVCHFTTGGLRQLIRDWRSRWGQGNFPFILNQLQQQLDAYTTAGINDVRDAQMQALQEPNTGMSVCFDSGAGLHPGKYIPAMRMARVARGMVYGESIEYMGPVYSGMTVEGSSIRVEFAHTGGGLIKKSLVWFQGDNNLAVGANVLSSSADANAPFEIADADNVYHPADAVIEGNTVVVSSPSVAAPVNARYGIEHPERAKTPLYNTDNLPASMFRTETWGGLGTATASSPSSSHAVRSHRPSPIRALPGVGIVATGTGILELFDMAGRLQQRGSVMNAQTSIRLECRGARTLVYRINSDDGRTVSGKIVVR